MHALVPPAYTEEIDPGTGVRNADAIVRFAGMQAKLIQTLAAPDKFLLAIGGDCSILIGHALGLKSKGRYGLFFLDGHTDYSWPGFSETGGAAGMDFAIVTGRGQDKLTDIGNRKPYFLPQDCLNAGNREYDPGYVAAIIDSGIPYTDLAQIRKTGMAAVAAGFLRYVEEEGLDGFWIHIDADVLNNEIMPAVDSPAVDGLWYDEWKAVLEPLLAHPKAVGMELTIIDPDLDPDGRYTRVFVREMLELFKPFTSAPRPSPGGLR